MKRTDVVVCMTDKTGKLGICSLETYAEMELKNVAGDKEIGSEEIHKIQGEINQHVSM